MSDKPFLLTTSKDPRPDHPVVQKAQDFVALVAEGASLEDAEAQTGLEAVNKEVSKRLRELGIYAKLDRVTGRAVKDARLWEVLLHGENRDSIAAAKALFPEDEAPQIEIHLSADVAKMDVTLPGDDKKENSK